MKEGSRVQLWSLMLSMIFISAIDASPSNFLADSSVDRIKNWIRNESALWLTFSGQLKTGAETSGVGYAIALGGAKLKSIDDVKRVGTAKLTPGNSNGPDVLTFSMAFVNLAVDYEDIVFYEKEIPQNVSMSLQTNGLTVNMTVAFEGDDDTCVGVVRHINVIYDKTKLVTTGGDNCPQAKAAVQDHFHKNIESSSRVLTFSSAVTGLNQYDLCRQGIVPQPTPIPTIPTTAPPTTTSHTPTTTTKATSPTTTKATSPTTTKATSPTTTTPAPAPTTTHPTSITTKLPPPSPPAPANELANDLGQFVTAGFQKHLYEWATIPQYTAKTAQSTIVVGQANFVSTSISMSNPHYEVKTADPDWVLTQSVELKNMVVYYNSITYALTGSTTYEHLSGDTTLAETKVNVSFPVQKVNANAKPCIQVKAGSQIWDNDLKWPTLNFVQTPGEKQHNDLKAIMEGPKIADFKTIVTQIVDKAIQFAVQEAQAWCSSTPSTTPTVAPVTTTTLPPITITHPTSTTTALPPATTTKAHPATTAKTPAPPSPPSPANELANDLGQFMTAGFEKHVYEWATIPQYTTKTAQSIIVVGQANFVSTSISTSNPHYEVKTADPDWVLTQSIELKNLVAHYNSITYAMTGNMTFDHLSGDTTLADTKVNVSFPVQKVTVNTKTCIQVKAGSQKWDNDLKWPTLNFVQTPGEKQHNDLKAIMEGPKIADFKTIVTQIVDKAIQFTVEQAQAWCSNP